MESKKPHTKHTISRTKIAELAKAFRIADKDQNGCLTEAEFLKVWRDQGVNISGEAATDFFRDKDTDLDGKISFEEFVGQLTEAETLWSILDKDEDGLIRLEDVEMAMQKYKKTLSPEHMEATLEVFHHEQTATSGEMTYAEFCGVIHGLKLSTVGRKLSTGGSRTSLQHAKVVPNLERQRSVEAQGSAKRAPLIASQSFQSSSSGSGDRRTQYSRHF